MNIICIPAFKDNYFWLIQPEPESNLAYIVDPGSAAPVIAALAEHQLTLAGILLTHHHHDHIDGALALHQLFHVPIYGPDSSRIPQVTHKVTMGENWLGEFNLCVIPLPGHTLDQIGYWFSDTQGQGHLFSGDALFGAGCGRLFDGTAAMHFQSLNTIAQLPDDTLIYGAHEYTLANIDFALHIDPSNALLVARQNQERKKRAQNLPTLPLSLDLEKATNPFLRCHTTPIRDGLAKYTELTITSDEQAFTLLRQLKDRF
jgi:hydroxyacylglutathione hydrolase